MPPRPRPRNGPPIEEPTPNVIAMAVEVLRAGGVVAVPTETVYGLAADALNESAVRRVFALKRRPADNPLIVHVLDAAHAQQFVSGWDERCTKLAATFWPGPLTLVLPKLPIVPDAVTAGHATVALRSPAHDVMRLLLQAFGGALAAPSANRSTGVSPTTAAHVAEEFAGEDELIVLDGGPCAVGIESTVLDMSRAQPCVLRPGAVSVEMLREVIGNVEASSPTLQSHSPGSSPRHYAPHTPSELLERSKLIARLASTQDRAVVICFDTSIVCSPHMAIALPIDAERCAAALYEALRQADASGAASILIERPAQSTGLWAAILDRLTRATAPR